MYINRKCIFENRQFASEIGKRSKKNEMSGSIFHTPSNATTAGERGGPLKVPFYYPLSKQQFSRSSICAHSSVSTTRVLCCSLTYIYALSLYFWNNNFENDKFKVTSLVLELGLVIVLKCDF